MKNNQTTFLKLCLSDALIKIMATQDYDAINVNTVCEQAQVGRTTFYRHFGNKSSKEELLRFKVSYEWNRYKDTHADDFAKDKTITLMRFVYENKQLLLLLNKNGVLNVVLCILEDLMSTEYLDDKNNSYLKSFFTYGQYGVIYQWAQYGFDETAEQMLQHVTETILAKQGN